MAVVVMLTICFLTMCSGYRKGPDEEDGFWEVYNLYVRTHMVITLFIIIILILWIPTIIIIIKLFVYTLNDVKFFRDDLPKLDGCINEFSIKEALDNAEELTADQLIMVMIQVSC